MLRSAKNHRKWQKSEVSHSKWSKHRKSKLELRLKNSSNVAGDSCLPSAGGAADGRLTTTTVAEESAYKEQARPLSETGCSVVVGLFSGQDSVLPLP